VDVIGSRVPIKKKGTSYFGCCPFHQEKSASFHVSPQKQFYYCFGCGAHGNVITFLREYDGLDFVESVESLAQLLGLEVPMEQFKHQKPEITAELSLLYEVLEKTNRFYQWNLRHHAVSNEVVEYLKKRQVSGKTAKKFELGFASDAWDAVLKQVGASPAFVAALIASGLVIQGDQNRQYDRFRHRLMFPIRDRKGQTVGFGGRVLSPEQEPKYLNSPETEVFHKGSLLYGLYELRHERFSEDFILIVEGYMDVVMLSEYGIVNAVATLGTAATPEHMKQLFRQNDHLVFCFDGDRAGQEAAKRAAKVILPFMYSAHRSARFLFLPFEDDPDSYVRKHGREAFLEEAKNAKPLLDFIWDILSKDLDLTLLGDRAQCVEVFIVPCFSISWQRARVGHWSKSLLL
jgi:DNA primase